MSKTKENSSCVVPNGTQRASSGISRGEMRESHVSLETPLDEEIATFEVGGHTDPRVGMKNCLAHGEVRAPCR